MISENWSKSEQPLVAESIMGNFISTHNNGNQDIHIFLFSELLIVGSFDWISYNLSSQ